MKMTNFLTILLKSLLYITFLSINFKYKTLLKTKSTVTLHSIFMAQLKVWSWVTSKVPSSKRRDCSFLCDFVHGLDHP